MAEGQHVPESEKDGFRKPSRDRGVIFENVGFLAVVCQKKMIFKNRDLRDRGVKTYQDCREYGQKKKGESFPSPGLCVIRWCTFHTE